MDQDPSSLAKKRVATESSSQLAIQIVARREDLCREEGRRRTSAGVMGRWSVSRRNRVDLDLDLTPLGRAMAALIFDLEIQNKLRYPVSLEMDPDPNQADQIDLEE